MSTDEFSTWLKKASDGSLGKMQGSSLYAGVVTSNFLKDPLCVLQLGYAIVLDKPIILIVDKRMWIPESLLKVAKLIERVDLDNQSDLKRVSDSIGRFANGLSGES